MPARANHPRVKPQPKIAFQPCSFKIDSTTLAKLKAYCELIESEQSYVIREALNYLFESDPTFQEFFAARLESDSKHQQAS
jgi:hypothetical protein